MIKVIFLIIVSFFLTSCISKRDSNLIENSFSPNIQEVYIQKIESNTYRVNIVLNHYSHFNNRINYKTSKLFINGKLSKIIYKSNSLFISKSFKSNDNYIDVELQFNTILGKNNPLYYNGKQALSNSKIINRSLSYIQKGNIGEGSIHNQKLYHSSKALLLGVKNYSRDFNPLPYISNDIKHLHKALKNYNFQIVVPTQEKLTTQILKNELVRFIDNASQDDRLIIYLSSHGFKHKDYEDRYIATSDCYIESAESTCLPLSFLKTISNRAKKKSIKHLLIITDSCFSGLGIFYAKGDTEKSLEHIAYNPGYHMITAGQANQIAEMSEKFKMSLFTYYLIDGLNGNANTSTRNNKEDSILTLHELFNYINYQVVKETHGTQIPSFGRIYGDGEMIFKLQ